MNGRGGLISAQQISELVNAALADPTIDLVVPLAMSLAFREGLPTTVLTHLSRGDYHPAVEDARGSLTYVAGDQVRVATLSPESENLLSAYLGR